jgi:hypothetical protein
VSERQPGPRAVGEVVAVHVWPADEDRPVPREVLELDLGGPVGDRHHGITARSDERLRWLYPMDTEVRNNRQVSLVDVDELAVVAANLGLRELAPGTIAENICTRGIPELSALAPMSRLVFGADGEDGPVVVVLGRNNPCTIAGGLVEQAYGTPAHRFPKAAINRRGVTGWVERAGIVRPGSPVRLIGVRPAG